MRDGTPDAGFLWRIGVGTLYLVRRTSQISLGDLDRSHSRTDPSFTVSRRTEPSPAFPCRTPCAARFTPRARDASPPPCSRRRRGARPYHPPRSRPRARDSRGPSADPGHTSARRLTSRRRPRRERAQPLRRPPGRRRRRVREVPAGRVRRDRPRIRLGLFGRRRFSRRPSR